mmetsp:Transcript_46062/g.112201  ORF Transcript_46062/g.112201 Transcript_46062/m.112201 type:complete len:148 (+) Transcript_46062:137-580(+)
MLWGALALFLGSIVSMCLVARRVFKFVELEEDRVNPTEFAHDLNRAFPREVGVHAVLVCAVALFFSPWLLLANAPLIASEALLISDGSWRVDASRVWTQEFKRLWKIRVVTAIVLHALCFFCYLANVLASIRIAAHHKRPWLLTSAQ